MVSPSPIYHFLHMTKDNAEANELIQVEIIEIARRWQTGVAILHIDHVRMAICDARPRNGKAPCVEQAYENHHRSQMRQTPHNLLLCSMFCVNDSARCKPKSCACGDISVVKGRGRLIGLPFVSPFRGGSTRQTRPLAQTVNDNHLSCTESATLAH